MSLSDCDILEAALEWQCDPAFDHFLFSENDLVKYVRQVLELERTGKIEPCAMCNGVGAFGTPGQRCFACDGSGKSKFPSPNAPVQHRLCHTWVGNKCKYCGFAYYQETKA
jgi:hypothetical protein